MTDDGYPTITIGRTEPLLQVAICLDLIYPILNIIEMFQKVWEFWNAQGFHFKFHSKEIILKWSKGEQPWLHATHCLVLICIPIKYHPNISRSISAIEHTTFQAARESNHSCMWHTLLTWYICPPYIFSNRLKGWLKLVSAQAFVYGLTDRLTDARLIAISAEPCQLGDKNRLGLDA